MVALAAPLAAAQNPVIVLRDCPNVCPEMVLLPAGSFVMGSRDSEPGRFKNEGPRRSVTIAQPVFVGRFEITFEQYDACVADQGCSEKPDDKGWGRGKRPVIHVNWTEARAYTRWLSRKTNKTYRLLTEAEWEYAARAGSSTRWHFGEDENRLVDYANYAGSGVGKTQPVGLLEPNAFGLFDMHGNVWEWVQDCYADNLNGTPVDGSSREDAPCRERVMRGGSYYFSARFLRVASRLPSPPSNRISNLGFRVARTLP
jgi:formylglycine-generating enzyme required for sulfatase activity